MEKSLESLSPDKNPISTGMWWQSERGNKIQGDGSDQGPASSSWERSLDASRPPKQEGLSWKEHCGEVARQEVLGRRD